MQKDITHIRKTARLLVTITLVLALLKAAGVIDCSWWIVATPIWGSLAIILIVVLIIMLNFRNYE